MHELGRLRRGQPSREQGELLVEGGAIELLHPSVDGRFEDRVFHRDRRAGTGQVVSQVARVGREHVQHATATNLLGNFALLVAAISVARAFLFPSLHSTRFARLLDARQSTPD